jgi:hypothetical protein
VVPQTLLLIAAHVSRSQACFTAIKRWPARFIALLPHATLKSPMRYGGEYGECINQLVLEVIVPHEPCQREGWAYGMSVLSLFIS